MSRKRLAVLLALAWAMAACDNSSPPSNTPQPQNTATAEPAVQAPLPPPPRAPDEVFQAGIKSHANPDGLLNTHCPQCGKALAASYRYPDVRRYTSDDGASFGVCSPECGAKLMNEAGADEKFARVRLKVPAE